MMNLYPGDYRTAKSIDPPTSYLTYITSKKAAESVWGVAGFFVSPHHHPAHTHIHTYIHQSHHTHKAHPRSYCFQACIISPRMFNTTVVVFLAFCLYFIAYTNAQPPDPSPIIHCTTPSGGGDCIDKTQCNDDPGGNNKPIPGYCPGASNIQCCVTNGVDWTEMIGIGIGIISAVSSSLVLLTGYMFRESMVHNKQYMKMILIMSFCACIGR